MTNSRFYMTKTLDSTHDAEANTTLELFETRPTDPKYVPTSASAKISVKNPFGVRLVDHDVDENVYCRRFPNVDMAKRFFVEQK